MACEGRGQLLQGGQEANTLLLPALRVAFDIQSGLSCDWTISFLNQAGCFLRKKNQQKKQNKHNKHLN